MTTPFSMQATDRIGPTYIVRATISAASIKDVTAATKYYDEHNNPHRQTTELRIDRARNMYNMFCATVKHEIVVR